MSSSPENKWQKKLKKSNPDFYAKIIDIMPSVPDLRPNETVKKMNKYEQWDPWHRLYDELSAMGIENDDAARDRELLELLTGEKKLKQMNWMELLPVTIRRFVITYPVLIYLIEKNADPVDLEGMWVALDRFDKLKNPKSKLTTLHVFADTYDRVDKLFDLYPNKWAWTETGKKTTFFGLLPANILMHLKYCGMSYHSGLGFKSDEIFISDLEFDPSYWNGTTEDDIYIANLKTVEKVAKKTKFPHREIICKQRGTKYTKYPKKEWYNKKREDGPDPVNSRSWNIVDQPYEVVRLDSAIKKAPLTIEDVFFACRAICVDNTRSYEEFYVINDEKGVLTLAVDIDNSST